MLARQETWITLQLTPPHRALLLIELDFTEPYSTEVGRKKVHYDLEKQPAIMVGSKLFTADPVRVLHRFTSKAYARDGMLDPEHTWSVVVT